MRKPKATGMEGQKSGGRSDLELKRRGFLVVLSGPSGAGKNTVLKHVLPRAEHLRYSVSATTRPPRPGEKDGVDYFFMTDAEFSRAVDAGEFLEWAEFCGFRYGTPHGFVEQMLDQGIDVITDIDIQGAAQIKNRLPEGVFVFLLPPSMAELKNRIIGRGTDSPEAIDRRLTFASEELDAMENYDYFIVNDDIERAGKRLEAIIEAEGLKVFRVDYEKWRKSLYDSLADEGGS